MWQLMSQNVTFWLLPCTPVTAPPQSKDNPPVSPSFEATLKANWELDDEIVFLDYIADHKAEAGDGMKFKASFWNGAAELMKAHTVTGGPKTAAGCSTKWDQVCDYTLNNKQSNTAFSSKSLTMLLLDSRSYQVSPGMKRKGLTLPSKMYLHGMSML